MPSPEYLQQYPSIAVALEFSYQRVPKVTLESMVAIQVHPKDKKPGRGVAARVKVTAFNPINPYNQEQAKPDC